MNYSEKSFTSATESELMTPFFEENKYQPISRVSIGALQDLGYEVNMNAADSSRRENKDFRFLSNAGSKLFPTSSFSLNETKMIDTKKTVKFFFQDVEGNRR